MSSRILREPGPGRAEPVVWPSLTAPQPAPAPEPSADKASDPAEALDRRLQEAHRSGYREGEAAGRAQLAPVLEQLARSIEALASLRPLLRKKAESDTVQLALAVARRILHRELTVDPEALEGLVRAAFEKLQGQEICRVRLWPGHETAVREWLDRLGAPQTVEIISDRSRQPGDVVFETARGALDASVESQLAEIEHGLADRLRRKP
jgi:flagellar assembly protein FliH